MLVFSYVIFLSALYVAIIFTKCQLYGGTPMSTPKNHSVFINIILSFNSDAVYYIRICCHHIKFQAFITIFDIGHLDITGSPAFPRNPGKL